MTSRTHTAAQAGPILFDARLIAGQVHVTVEDRSHAEITISTADTTGASADAVTNATINEQNGRITATVRPAAGGGVTVQGGGVQTNVFGGRGISVMHNGGVVVAGNVVGGVIVTGDMSIVNGVVVGGGTVVVGGSPILVEAKLPAGSSVAAETTSADLEVVGDVVGANVRTVSGDVRLGGVTQMDVHSTSGDITVDRFAGSGRAQTVSGDITVHAVREATLSARAVSGDVRVSGARVALEASSVSGRVSQR